MEFYSVQAGRVGLRVVSRVVDISQRAVFLADHPAVTLIVPKKARRIVTLEEPIRIVDAQGVITKNNIGLALETADCLPLVFWDRQKKLIGLAHFGYRELLFNVLPKFLRAWQEAGGIPSETFVFFGPGICGDCYLQTGWRTLKTMLLMGKKKRFIRYKNGKSSIDLRAAALDACLDFGIRRDNIDIVQACTFEDPGMPSYQRQKKQRTTNILTTILTQHTLD